MLLSSLCHTFVARTVWVSSHKGNSKNSVLNIKKPFLTSFLLISTGKSLNEVGEDILISLKHLQHSNKTVRLCNLNISSVISVN